MSGALAGAAVLVTRPRGEGAELKRQIEALGAIAIRQPGIELRATPDREPTRARLQDLTGRDWLVFTSPAAVRFVLPRLKLPPDSATWAVGGRTAADLERAGLVDVGKPTGGSGSEALLADPRFADVAGRRILILSARGGRTELHQELSRRGARVEPVYVYRRSRPRLRRIALARLYQHFERSIVTATSAEILENLTALYRDRLPAPLTRRPLVVVSTRIAARATALGYRRVTVSESPASESIVAALTALAGAW